MLYASTSAINTTYFAALDAGGTQGFRGYNLIAPNNDALRAAALPALWTFRKCNCFDRDHTEPCQCALDLYSQTFSNGRIVDDQRVISLWTVIG
jgi:hypothetical protein